MLKKSDLNSEDMNHYSSVANICFLVNVRKCMSLLDFRFLFIVKASLVMQWEEISFRYCRGIRLDRLPWQAAEATALQCSAPSWSLIAEDAAQR